jgi:hypothetical protein
MEQNIVDEEVGNIVYQELSWLAKYTELATHEPDGQLGIILTIDKDMAIRLMERNEDNRGLKGSVIEKINRDILNVRYYLNGETISISKTMKLLNGQHRLTSVIATGIPIRTWVVFGVDDICKTTFDQGTAKSAADYLKMMRVASSKDVSILVKLLLFYAPGIDVTNKDVASRKISKQDILTEYEKFQDPIQYAMITFGLRKTTKIMKAVASISAAHVLISREVPESIVDTFFDTITGTGGNIDHENPVLWLRAKLTQVASDKKIKFEASSEAKLNFILRTWNAYIMDKKLTRLRIDPIFPRIVRGNKEDLDQPEETEEQ